MKFLVLTAASEEFQPLAEITEKGKELYANEHDYDYMPLVHFTPKKIQWERVKFWRRTLEQCDWLFFTGCDAMITNNDIKLEDFIDDKSDFIFAIDCNGLQSDSWLMRNCEATRKFLASVANWEGKIANEQHAMALELSGEPILSNFLASMPVHEPKFGTSASSWLLDCLRRALNKSDVRCKIVPQRRLNAYPEVMYGGTGREAWSWRPGDFICHLPGKSLKERIEFFKTIL